MNDNSADKVASPLPTFKTKMQRVKNKNEGAIATEEPSPSLKMISHALGTELKSDLL